MENLPRILIISMVFGSPVWLPIVFAAYAIGRRQFSLLVLFLLLTAEAVSITAMVWLMRTMS
jgi:hypothetical protein